MSCETTLASQGRHFVPCNQQEDEAKRQKTRCWTAPQRLTLVSSKYWTFGHEKPKQWIQKNPKVPSIKTAIGIHWLFSSSFLVFSSRHHGILHEQYRPELFDPPAVPEMMAVLTPTALSVSKAEIAGQTTLLGDHGV